MSDWIFVCVLVPLLGELRLDECIGAYFRIVPSPTKNYTKIHSVDQPKTNKSTVRKTARTFSCYVARIYAPWSCEMDGMVRACRDMRQTIWCNDVASAVRPCIHHDVCVCVCVKIFLPFPGNCCCLFRLEDFALSLAHATQLQISATCLHRRKGERMYLFALAANKKCHCCAVVAVLSVCVGVCATITDDDTLGTIRAHAFHHRKLFLLHCVRRYINGHGCAGCSARHTNHIPIRIRDPMIAWRTNRKYIYKWRQETRWRNRREKMRPPTFINI